MRAQRIILWLLPAGVFLGVLACELDRPLPLEGRAGTDGGAVLQAAAAQRQAPWSLFGAAAAVRVGQPPNPWAVELRSETSGLGFGGVAFDPAPDLTFADIQVMSADFNVTDDDCGGGSPRFQIGLDTDRDGDFDGNIFVALGPSPNFTGCPGGWQSTGNLIGNADHGRYDASQVGGSGFGTYADALAAAGGARVLGVQLVVDGSWFFADGEQTVWVDNVQVNQHRLTAHGFAP